MLWVVDRVDQSGSHSISVGVETDVRLYIVLVGPPPADRGMSPPVTYSVSVTTPDGGALRGHGTGMRGDPAEAFLVALFDPPHSDVKHLNVSLACGSMERPSEPETPDVAARLRRLP